MPETPEFGPLILGASGRIGRSFRRIAAAGLWPGKAPPLWHSRDGAVGDYVWDMSLAPAPVDPRLSQVRGMIVLAGGRGKGEIAAESAAALVRAALDLAEREGIARVLVASSQAVYGAGPGPFAETAPTLGTSDYARAKCAAETAARGRATCLRIGNVAGADMLLSNAARGPVTLDRFADGHGPRRAYVGPLSLARICAALLEHEGPLPEAVNVAAPGEVAMADLLAAAGLGWTWTDAPPEALPRMMLDLGRLAALVPLDPDWGRPETLIAEARAGGWSPAT